MSITAVLKNSPVYSLITKWRATKAKRVLHSANLYPDDIDKIAEDFLFSIERDYRGIM